MTSLTQEEPRQKYAADSEKAKNVRLRNGDRRKLNGVKECVLVKLMRALRQRSESQFGRLSCPLVDISSVLSVARPGTYEAIRQRLSTEANSQISSGTG